MSLILSGTDGLSDVDGTAATPAIRGTDANTGIFFGTDIIGFSEGGVEAARIDASGNLGVGVTPSYRLDVARSGNGVSARFSQGSFFSYIYSGSTASYFMADTGALTSYGVTASTLQMSAGNGADQLVVSQTSVKPNVLLDISGASAGQIKFPATQNASSDANTLDDYEEGTWTPDLGGTTTYASRNGFYVKIGRLVFVSMNLQVTLIGTGSATVISGLPFAQSGGGQSTALSVSIYSTLASNVVSIQPYVNTTSSAITMFSALAAGAVNAQNAIFQNSTRVDITGCYTSA